MTIKQISGDWKHHGSRRVASAHFPGRTVGSMIEVLCPRCEGHSWQSHHGTTTTCPGCSLLVTVYGATLRTNDKYCGSKASASIAPGAIIQAPLPVAPRAVTTRHRPAPRRVPAPQRRSFVRRGFSFTAWAIGTAVAWASVTIFVANLLGCTP